MLRLERKLTVSHINRNEKAVDLTAHMDALSRLSLLEDLRMEMAKVTHDEYPSRLRRVLTITKRSSG